MSLQLTLQDIVASPTKLILLYSSDRHCFTKNPHIFFQSPISPIPYRQHRMILLHLRHYIYDTSFIAWIDALLRLYHIVPISAVCPVTAVEIHFTTTSTTKNDPKCMYMKVSRKPATITQSYIQTDVPTLSFLNLQYVFRQRPFATCPKAETRHSDSMQPSHLPASARPKTTKIPPHSQNS